MRGMIAALIVLVASSAAAQDRSPRITVTDVVKRVVFDPTTYAPAIVTAEAMHLDWRSSQVFFQHGWVEHNAQFTVSGRPDDIAIGYTDGKRVIVKDAFMNLQVSLLNNVSERVFEGLLMTRYPHHRTLLRTVGWIERITMASYRTYSQSAGHFRQWQANERRAQQLGYE